MGDLAETFRSPRELLSRLVLCGEAGGEREARGARRCASGEAGPSAGVSCRAAKARGESCGEGPRDAGFPGANPPRARVGPGTSRDPGLVPLGALGARAHPGDRTERWALARAGGYSACGRPGRCAHWSGCVGSVASNFSPIPLVSHRRARDRARGAGHQCPRGAGSRWDGQQEDGAGGVRDARSKGRGRGPARSGRPVPGRRGRRRRVLGGSRHWDLRMWGGEGAERVTWRRTQRVMSGHLQVHFHSFLQERPGVLFGDREQRYQIAPGFIWGLGIGHSAVQTLFLF